METPTPDPLFGITLHERYILGKRLRGGASGNVHVAHDLGADRTVTVTILYSWLQGNHGAVHAFLDRAQTLEGLSHPGLAQTLDHGRDGDHVYAVGEYLPGRILSEVLDEGGGTRYEPHTALTLVAGVLAMLDVAHNAGLVHGDLGPDKIVVDDEGGVRVTSFPLLFDAERDAGPETHTDVHAVGRLLYTLVTGVVADPESRPLRPSSVVPGLASDLDMLVANATDPNPRYRPRDAGQYLTMVEQVLRALPRSPSGDAVDHTQPIPAVIEGSAVPAVIEGSEEHRRERTAPVPPRRRVPLLVGAGVLVLALFAVGWTLVPDGRAELPDVLGSSTTEAEERLAALELDLEVRFDETYSDTVDAGDVADSTPAPGSGVERGAEVLLWVSAGARYVEIPDVVGGTENDARETLRESGFAEIEIVQEHSAEHSPGTVLSTEPAVGDDGDREEPVVLHVSEGVIVPTLVGMTGEEAGTALDELGLTAEVVEDHHDTVPVGEVSGQSPEPGAILPEEGTATITVSTGPAPEEPEEEAVPPEEEESESPQNEGSCDAPEWDPGVVYDTGDLVSFQGREYEARWYIQGFAPTTVEEWGVWEDRGPC